MKIGVKYQYASRDSESYQYSSVRLWACFSDQGVCLLEHVRQLERILYVKLDIYEW